MKQKYLLKILLLLCFAFTCNSSFGQDILTFEFNGLTGSETTANSTTNNSNISTSIISRGAGLTASNNGNRFNATSWNTGTVTAAITGNDYMEFTITPNATFQFTVSSIDVNIQRSGSGARAVTLRSSLDSYASNLDTEKVINDNTSTQTFSFTFSQSASSTAVTYRFYLHNAEGTGGSGGFEGSGNDIVVNGTVVSASSDTSVSFVSSTSSVSENGTSIDVCVAITNPDATNATTVEIALDGSSTAVNPGDYTPSSALPATLTFPAGSSANQCLTINLTNDAITEASETGVFNLQNVAGGSSAVIGITTQHTLTIIDDDLPNIVISEIMYNTPGTDDEWIEIYNPEASSVDILGWTIENTSPSSSYTIPASTIIAAGTYMTIAIGSNGDGTFNNDNPFTPDLNSLGVVNSAVDVTNDSNNLVNSSSTITIKSGSNTIDEVTYTNSDISSTDGNGSSYEIVDLSLDNSATSSNWQASPNDGGSPGGPSATNWTGVTDNSWIETSNWTAGVPIATSDVSIPSGLTNYPTISTGSAIIVNNINIESGASLIANGTATLSGEITYQRDLTTNWHLISSPVEGQQIGSFITASGLTDGTVNTDHTGLGFYNNATPVWEYFLNSALPTSNFIPGNGYAALKTAAGTVDFTGTLKTSDLSSYAITEGDDGWNLVGNPYPSYIDVNAFLTSNLASFEASFANVYVWNGTAYAPISGATYMAPGQGFFVKSVAGGATIDITEAMQSHQSATFYRNNSNPEINLSITDQANNIRKAKINFLDGKTTGLDPMFDVGMFTATNNSYAVYSHLISDSQGIDFEIQALPNQDYETVIVPIGINAVAGKEITFKVEDLNLPAGIKVFLEDRENNTFIRLDEDNSQHTVNVTNPLSGIGRFYLRTSSSILTVDDLNLENINIYTMDNSTLRITGIEATGKKTLSMFDILGQRIVQESFNTNGVKDITLPNVSSGVYIIHLQTERGRLSKKIILN